MRVLGRGRWNVGRAAKVRLCAGLAIAVVILAALLGGAAAAGGRPTAPAAPVAGADALAAP